MNWFDILKESRQIGQSSIKTKIGTRPLTISNEDDNDCCEIAREQYQNWMDNGIYTNTDWATGSSVIAHFSCERLEHEIQMEIEELLRWYDDYDFFDTHIENLNFDHPKDLEQEAWNLLDILEEWVRCENE